jgi:hypothetical protein
MKDSKHLAEKFRKLFLQDPWLYSVTALGLLFLACYICFFIISALQQGVQFNGYAADGPFQLYNPLRRLAAGEVPGRDFQFFHGIGVPLLHYPLFRLLGGNVFASETTRNLITPALFLISGYTFCYAVLRRHSKTVVATSLLLLVSLKYVDVIYPSNSLIGIRTTFPLFVAAAILWQNQSRLSFWLISVRWKSLLVMTLLALSFMCGTEQGVAAIISYTLVELFVIWRTSSRKTHIQNLLIELGLLGFITLLMYTITTYGHPLRPLLYALRDVPSDQFWYFGTPPNSYLNWHNILPGLTSQYLLYVYAAIAIAIALIAVAKRKFNIVTNTQIRAYAFLILYGVLACSAMLGYFAPAQAIPLMRVVLAICVVVLVSVILLSRINFSDIKNFSSKRYGTYFVLTCLVIAGWSFLSGSYRIMQTTRKNFAVLDVIKAVPGAYHASDYAVAGVGWKSSLNSFKPYLSKPHATVWSTYSSLYDNRSEYVHDFEHTSPQYVITMRPTYFYYEEWLWPRQPDFYSYLLSHYHIVTFNGSHFLWAKNDTAVVTNDSWTTVQPTRSGDYKLPAAENRLSVYEVSATYSASSKLPGGVASKLPRYLLQPHGTALAYDVALDPATQKSNFFVPVIQGQTNPYVSPKTDGLIPSAELHITSLKYRLLHTDTANNKMFYDAICVQQNHLTAMLGADTCKF